jgi:hypothetical protein
MSRDRVATSHLTEELRALRDRLATASSDPALALAMQVTRGNFRNNVIYRENLHR